jgi:hypothetical protein
VSPLDVFGAANDNVPTGAAIRFAVEPRLIPAQKAARRLHLSFLEFREKLQQLRAQGFPPPCSVTGHYDLKAIDIWLDDRSGLGGSAGAPAPLDVAQILDEGFAALG